MHGFGLLVSHLLGDFLLQNDWMARNKSSMHPGLQPQDPVYANESDPTNISEFSRVWQERNDARTQWRQDLAAWHARYQSWCISTLACTVHCLVYTLAVFMCCWWFMSWWTYPVIGLLHYPVDRYRLARKAMTWMGQEKFATDMGPWSVIVVDNTYHLIVLYACGLLSM